MPDPANPPANGSSATPDFRQLVADAVSAADRNPHRVAKTLLARIKDLEQRLEAKVPAGAVVLSAEDAKLFESYKALGKPDEVKATLDKVPVLEGQIAARDTAEARRKAGKAAASALGWNEAVTVDLITDKGYTVELREVEVEEKDAKGAVTKVKKSLPHVLTGEGTAAKADLLDAVIQRDHAGYLPALQATAAAGAGSSGGSGSGGTGGSGAGGAGATGRTITWPSGQRAGGSGGGATSAVDEVLEKNRERAQAPNALRPAKAG